MSNELDTRGNIAKRLRQIPIPAGDIVSQETIDAACQRLEMTTPDSIARIQRNADVLISRGVGEPIAGVLRKQSAIICQLQAEIGDTETCE